MKSVLSRGQVSLKSASVLEVLVLLRLAPKVQRPEINYSKLLAPLIKLLEQSTFGDGNPEGRVTLIVRSDDA